jgi:GNAT superfamily N-acetyltransferase
MPSKFQIRRATPDDIAIIAHHRAQMFQDMGELSAEAADLLRAKAQPVIESALRHGDYLAWLASCTDNPEIIIAGAGVHLHQIFPRPLNQTAVSEGRQATIVNVFTEPEWRRKGIAALLLQRVIDWSRTAGVARLVLHASEDGRSLYEKLGFVANNEMKFVDE